MRYNDKNIFVSTGAFQEKDLSSIFSSCSLNQWFSLELSSGIDYGENDIQLLKRIFEADEYKFLIHNYFPVPEIPFVLNLASLDLEILKRSRNHCKNAISLAAKLCVPFYSVHCGFCFFAEPEHLGMELRALDRFPRKQAHDIFIESIRILSEYAGRHGIGVLIENNVLAPFNTIEGENELLLGVTADGLTETLEDAACGNIGLLLDVGHLKVSAQTLGFSPELFLERLGTYIKAVHLSDNDGCSDTNQPIHEQSWFWEPLGKVVSSEAVWVLEVYNLSQSMIESQLKLVRSKLDSMWAKSI